jgi:phytepsin
VVLQFCSFYLFILLINVIPQNTTTPASFTLEYYLGQSFPNFTGTIVQDTVIIGGLVIPKQTFIGVNQADGVYISTNGVVGLAFMSLAVPGTTTLLDNMVEQGLISEQVFSYFFNIL